MKNATAPTANQGSTPENPAGWAPGIGEVVVGIGLEG
jgi:hypothetical protein